MNNNTLPTDDLKKYGIINADNSFTKKMSAEDIMSFLQGNTMIADNQKNRIVFQLVENNSKLNVKMYEREEKISELLENSKYKIQYSNIMEKNKPENERDFEKKAFFYEKDTNRVKELDFVKDAKEITQLVLEKENFVETNRYKTELLKLKGFLEQKIAKFPEIAKEITVDLNIVSNEINTVNSNSRLDKQQQKEGKEDVQLNVNDEDLYQDASQKREEQEEQQQRPKGRGR